jgi:hypothetical protein
MYPCTYKNSLLRQSFRTLRVSIFARDRKVFTSITRQGSSQSASMEKVLSGNIFFYPCDIILQIRISVWEAMSEEYLIVVSTPLVIKLQRIEITRLFIIITFECVLEVLDVFTNSVPSDPFGVLHAV